ncbi:MAG: HK97 gp10 family phage protein [Planctomycetota bacterium]
MNWKEYAAYLRKQADKLPAAVAMPVFRRRAVRVLQLAIQNTPVNTGRLRSGWHVTVDTPSGQVPSGVSFGASASAVLKDGEKVINECEFGRGVWIQNNVPYAPVIEYGLFQPPDPGPSKASHVPKSRRKRVAGTVLVSGGFHVSAPNGMLADAVQQVEEAAKAGIL